MENWKQIIAGFGIFGFVLSFIIGLLGRVGFGSILLRAFIFAVLFSGIGFLILKIIETFIPELISEADKSEDTESSDIIEDDFVSDGKAPDVSGSKLDITIEDEEDELEVVQELEEFGEDVQPQPSNEEREEPEILKEVDEKQTVTAASAESSGSGEKGELPDIGEFADSFEAADLPGNSEGLSSIDGTGSSGSAEILGGMHETQEIVKAVKTVLKKDQEG